MSADKLPDLLPIRTRFLKTGEWVDFSEIGVPGVKLSGPSVEVAEHEDGSLTACGMPLSVVKDIEGLVFAILLIYPEMQIGRRELYYLRSVAEMTVRQMAELLRIAPEAVIDFEKNGGSLSREQLNIVRGALLPRLIQFLRGLAPHVREANRPHFERAQSIVTQQDEFAPEMQGVFLPVVAGPTRLRQGMMVEVSR